MQSPTTRRGSRFAIAVACVLPAIAALAAQYWINGDDRTLWSRAIFDAGHVPVFGIVAVCVLFALRALRGRASRVRDYLIAFAVAAVLGALSELAQLGTERQASFADFARDLAGASGFLGIALSFDRAAIASLNRPAHVPTAALVGIAAATALALGMIPFGAAMLAYAGRDQAFPRLLEFDGYWETRFLQPADSTVTLSYLPEPWARDAPQELVGHVRFQVAAYSGIRMLDTHPDWSEYERFAFRVWSPLDRPVSLQLRVDDSDSPRGDDRYYGKVTIVPGRNDLEIPLDVIRQGPRDRELDLRTVHRFLLYAVGPKEPFDLYVDAFRLE
jgi:hypothetical protein